MDGVVLHESDRIEDSDATVHEDTPVTTLTRTIIDMAGTRSSEWLVDALSFAERTRRGSIRRVRTRIGQLPTAPGRRRLLTAARVIDEEAAARAESGLEHRARTALVTRGVPPPVVNPRLVVAGRKRRPDLAWLDIKVAVELHGPPHLLPSQRMLDCERDVEFTRDGWLVIYVTEEDLDCQPELVAEDVKRLLAIRSQQFPSSMGG